MVHSRNCELGYLLPVCCNLAARRMMVVLVLRHSSSGIPHLFVESDPHCTLMKNSALSACNHFGLFGLCIGSVAASEVWERGIETLQPHHNCLVVPSVENSIDQMVSDHNSVSASVGHRLVHWNSSALTVHMKHHLLGSCEMALMESAERASMRIGGGIAAAGSTTAMTVRDERPIDAQN